MAPVTAGSRPPTRTVADFAPRDRLVKVGPTRLRLLQALVVVALVAAWQLSASAFVLDEYTSSPVDVVRQLVDWHQRGVLWEAMWVTFLQHGSPASRSDRSPARSSASAWAGAAASAPCSNR